MSTYGDDWRRYWDEWRSDEEWWNLLAAAEGGDTLVRATLGEGGFGLSTYTLEGNGHTLLKAVYRTEQLTKNAARSDPERATLGEVYAGKAGCTGGFAVLRFGDDGAIDVVGRARLSVTSYSVSRGDAFAWQMAVAGLAGAGGALGISNAGIQLLFGMIVGSASSQAVGEYLPGAKAGDVRLTLGLGVDMGEFTAASSHEWIFRNGTNTWDNGGHSWISPKHPYVPPPVGP